MNLESHPILGKDDQAISLATKEDNFQATLQMLQQARQTLYIYAQLLDPPVYNQQEIYDALLTLATNNRHVKIQILVQDTQKIMHSAHRLIELSRKIPSFLQIRKIHSDFVASAQCFMIADDTGLILRSQYTRYEAIANFKVPLECKKYLALFTEVWEKSVVDTELRRLNL